MQDTLGTFRPSLVTIGLVVSKEKIFERNNIKNKKKKNIEKGQWLQQDLTN